MAKGTTVRLPDPLKTEATAYAESLGISLNALIAVALRDYLDLRQGLPEPPPCELPPLEDYPEFADPNEPAMPKVGRNAPCPCGSGKKYKLCHGR